MQDTFVSVMQSASSYQPSGKPMAWLLTIARNLALMRLRKAENKNISFDELFHVEDPHNAYRETENHMVLDKVRACSRTVSGRIVMLHALSRPQAQGGGRPAGHSAGDGDLALQPRAGKAARIDGGVTVLTEQEKCNEQRCSSCVMMSQP